MWEKTAETLKNLSEEGIYDGPISVNVSRVDVTAMNVAEEFEKIVSKYGIKPEMLHIEITESACEGNKAALISMMDSLREKGFVVEIDDFGSGYSSLNALMELPFDIVKLDMDFMRDGEEDASTEMGLWVIITQDRYRWKNLPSL